MQPRLLCIETSTRRGVVALSAPDGSSLSIALPADKRHASDLIPSIQSLLQQASVELRQLNAIAVGVGPGSFTGLRVGLAAAKTLAYALGCKLIGLDSLSVIAAAVPGVSGSVVVVADAQRGEWCVARYRRGNVEQTPCLLEPGCIQPQEQVVRSLRAGDLLIGPGLERRNHHPEIEAPVLADQSQWFPQGTPLVRCALTAWSLGDFDDPWTVEPRYFRASAAEEKARRSAAR